MSKEILNAFKRLEKKLEDQKLEEKRRVEREKFLVVQRELEKKRRRMDLAIYSGMFFFLVVVGYMINSARLTANAEGKSFKNWAGDKVVEFVDSFEEEPVCDIPENWRTEECILKRKRETEANWRSLSLGKDGKDGAFSVNTPDKAKKTRQ